MTHYDVFNGDADGICALQQLRLAAPKESTLITGVKRDIQLLQKVDGNKSDTITVLDISLDKNREDLNRLLEKSITIDYFDHHFAGDIPSNSYFNAHIDTAPDTCTSLIVNDYLSDAHPLWAIVGAFGDNFDEKALSLANSQSLTKSETESLKKLGIAINYNAYGASTEDLHFNPVELTKAIRPFHSPLDFIKNSDIFTKLQSGYENDLAKATELTSEHETECTSLYILPNQAWARRISGVFANILCKNTPTKAHALLTEQDDNSYLVSVRAPLITKIGADELCRQFPSGGGRKAAAGINNLPISQIEEFKAAFNQQFSR